MNWAIQEMKGAKIGHERYRSNAMQILFCMGANSGLSLSAALGERLRKSAHRLFSQQQIDLQQGHREQSVLRCAGHEWVLALEDTTDLNYQDHPSKQGMGQLGGMYDCRGVSIHSALLVSPQGEPLGLLGQHIWAPSSSGREKRPFHYTIEEKESYKWLILLKQIEANFKSRSQKVLIVADREADFYEHLVHDRSPNIGFVIRGRALKRNILVGDKPLKVQDLPDLFELKGMLEVALSKQKNRDARVAKLALRYGTFTYPPPFGHQGKSIQMSLVHAREVDGPTDAIEWYLFTSLPVNTFEDAQLVLDIYTKRWMIERFHYILKTGLRVEKLQIDNFERLVNALKMYAIVGWRILHLNYVAKASPERKAGEVFEQVHIQILHAMTRKQIKTVVDFVVALGSLAGFKPTKKQPLAGEKLLWQAWSILHNVQWGWTLAKDKFNGTG